MYKRQEYDLSMAETCMESLKKYYHTDFPEGEKQFTVLVLGAAEIQEFTDEASRQTYMAVSYTHLPGMPAYWRKQ